MTREIPGSSFEGGDDRTWDEMGLGRELVEDDDDYPGDDTDDEEDDRDWERLVDENWRIRADLEEQRQVFQERIAARPAAGPLSFDPDSDLLQQVTDDIDDIDAEFGAPPPGWSPSAITKTPTPIPAGRHVEFEAALAKSLTPEQLQHWRWLAMGKTQDFIADQLKISQPAVFKREKKLRPLVDEAHQAAYGKPYHWVRWASPRGGRPRRL